MTRLHPVIRPAIIAIILAVLTAIPLIQSSAAHAASVGLQISPVRQYLSVDAGGSVSGAVTVTNHTGQPLDVTMSIQQFSVADYSYDYEFSNPANDWLHLGETAVRLSPDASHAVPYTIQPPAGTAPGGHYYTIVASARVSAGSTRSTIQAAQPVYLTVNGELRRTSKLNASSLSRLALGRKITYSVEPINTGNIYFFAYLSGQLDGMLVHQSADAGTHMLMPGKPRRLTGSIPSPILPGAYKVSFGYRTDADTSVTVSKWIIYIPPWFIAFLLAALLLGGKRFSRRRRKQQHDKQHQDASNN